jgi:uncharacterized membrane protein YfcA
MEQKSEKKMGWEIAREVEKEKPTIGARAKIGKEKLWVAAKYLILFGILFIIAAWLAGNPFEFSQRIPSQFVREMGWAGTDSWAIVWWVVIICACFEFLDSSAGMGYGTALSPLLLSMGFDPKQVIPLIMITEMLTGFTAGLIHGEFENVEWKWHPMNETTKMVTVVALIGMASTFIAISSIYAYFELAKFWIKVYVAVLLIMMGVTALYTSRTWEKYHPRWMWGFALLAGFNKGVGGGGYGPVVTVGGVIAGVPVKSMVAITSYAEAFTCVAANVTWFALLSTGMIVDYMLLPSMVLGTLLAAFAAPYMTRIFPEKLWKWVIPVYCCGLAIYAFYKIWPDLAARLK